MTCKKSIPKTIVIIVTIRQRDTQQSEAKMDNTLATSETYVDSFKIGEIDTARIASDPPISAKNEPPAICRSKSRNHKRHALVSVVSECEKMRFHTQKNTKRSHWYLSCPNAYVFIFMHTT